MQHATALQALIAADPARMHILHLVRELALPDCWVAAGFVRTCAWDHLHGFADSPLPQDVDVIWFDVTRASREGDAALEAALRVRDGAVAWSVKNQARMHGRNGDAPYLSAVDAMRYWPETATCIGVRLDAAGRIAIAAPLGLDDLFGLVLRPTARFAGDKHSIYLERVRVKGWCARWPRLSER